MVPFRPGLALSEQLFRQVVQPVLTAVFPNLPYAAALLGWGSEVLGYDDAISTDHNWGPRLQLFLSPADRAQLGEALLAQLDAHMPATLGGRPTCFEINVPDHQRGVSPASLISDRHNVEVHTVPAFLRAYLGRAPDDGLDPIDWLLFSEHRLLTVTSGRVFHDDSGELSRARETFRFFPPEVWRFLLAAQWGKLAEEEAFPGRSGDAGDELGSRLIAARQVRLMVQLSFLMERRYSPYAKWLGTAFSRLGRAAELAPLFTRILDAGSWQERDAGLAAAYEALARRHNELGLTPALATKTESFHERPYRVLFAGRFANALFETVRDRTLQSLPYPTGSINQLVDGEWREIPRFSRRLSAFYRHDDAE